MVPEGLVLLTSVAFMVAAVTLARRNVLVQELPAVEGLARVDVVCLDKTGTLTEGEIEFDELELLDGADANQVEAALGALADDANRNATLSALAAAVHRRRAGRAPGAVPFSSARKWSAATLRRPGHVGDGRARDGARRLGGLAGRSTASREQANTLAAGGRRVVVLALHGRRRSRAKRCPTGCSRSRS